MKPHLKSFASVAVLSAALLAQPASAQWAVIDHANLVANIRQAADEVQQINNQIQSLQHEITMIQTMERNLESLATSPLGAITSDLDQVKSLMTGGPGIPFLVGDSQSAFDALWPQSYPTTVTTASLESDAQGRWKKAMAAFAQTLSVQSQIAQNVLGDTATLSQVLNASQGASGNLDAVQAGNQLLALSTKQQLQTQSLMAAQYRADALQQANQAEAEEEGRAEFTNFLGSDSAYTP
jgi:P-type conjugative transfer protein TrbJ